MLHDEDAGQGRGEDGFVLLESIVSIMLMGVLMAALAPFFSSSISLMSRQRATQGATQVATSQIETIRGLQASDLVTGHDASSVSAQFAAAPAVVKQPWLDTSVMTQAVDSSAASGAGRTAAVPTVAVVQTPNNIVYSVSTYLGRCQIPAGGTNDDCTSTTTTDSVSYLRAVVAVTWSQPRCPNSLCSYVTATLLSATADPTFNLKQAPPAVPVVVNPGPQTATVGRAITPLQLAVQSGTGVPVMTWAITGGSLPAGLALTTAGLISGVPTTVTAARSVTVTVTDAFLRTASATFTWTVLPGPTVASPGAQRSSVGATVNLALTTTCPSGPCTYTLNNGPAGLSVTAAGVVTGTVGGAAQVYNGVTVTVTDVNGASATSAAFVWTVVGPPTVTAPGTQTTTTGGAVNLTLGSTCPSSPCTFALNNGPAGLSISASGVVTGTVTSAAQVFSNVTVTITDASGVTGTSAVFTWNVLARPAVASPGPQGTTTGAAVSLPLTTTCANAPCSYVLNNGPAGLTISSAGVVSGTITSGAQAFTSASVTVTDAGGVSVTSSSFTWTVYARPSVTAPANQTTLSGASVNLTLTRSCPNAPCTYVLNNGPAGLSISTAGVVSGTVTSAAQTFGSVSVTVTDASGISATSGTFTWTVTSAPVSAVNPGPQRSTVGTAITPLQLTSTGGSGSVTWSAVSSLPAGLTLRNTGLISGTPTTAGTTSVTVRATDTATGATSNVTFTWTVVARPTIGNPGLIITSVGATRSVALAYTCPYASCTITLDGTVPGLGLSTAATNTTNNTVDTITVTATSGTIYVAGVVQTSAVTTGTLAVFTPSLTVTDGAGAATTSADGTWYVLR